MGFKRKLLEVGNKLTGCDVGFNSGSSNLDFYNAVRKAFVANDELEWGADQIRVIEFNAGAIGTVVPQDLDACRH